jgi:adiponectin receptor
VNIWSHLFGALWFFYNLIGFVGTDSAQPYSIQDRLILGLFSLSVATCCLLSAVFHILCDHSIEVHTLSNQLDHFGILFMMWAAGLSTAHFALRCRPTAQRIYIVLLSAAAAQSGLITARPTFRAVEQRWIRVLVYSSFGASLFAPVIHGLFVYGVVELDERMGLKSFVGLALLNSLGGGLYIARVPDRWFPGRFDLIGQGHNWMHILAVVGAQVRLQGMAQAAHEWQQHKTECGAGF